MRMTVCDVCGEQYEADAPMISMVIPPDLIDEEDGLAVDVCGWPCVTQLVDIALERITEPDEDDDDDEDEEVPPEEKDRFVMIPKTPSIDVDMDEQQLAHFTEQVTGVKRRI